MEYFEFYNPVKLLCGESALENIPYELAILGSKRPLVLISRTMMEDGILEQIGGHYQAIIEYSKRFFLFCGGRAGGKGKIGRM